MNKIRFMGKEYESLASMPPDVRRDYLNSRNTRNYEDTEMSKSRSFLEQLSPEIREMYERAAGKVEQQVEFKSSPLDHLPKSEELFDQRIMSKLERSEREKIIYQPSSPIIGNQKPALEADRMNFLTPQRFIFSLIILVILTLAVYWVFSS